MAKVTIPNITGSFASVTQLNDAFDSLETELNDKVLYRTNPVGEPNSMSNDVDLSNNDLLNVKDIQSQTLTLAGVLVAPTSVVTAPLASQEANTPAGNIASVDVQGALNELDSEKIDTTANTFIATQTIRTPAATSSLVLDSDSGYDTELAFKEATVTRAKAVYDESIDTLSLTKYDTDGTTVVAQVDIPNTGVINVSTGSLQVAGVAPLYSLPSASESAEGIVERATTAEVSAGTDTTRFVSSKLLKDHYVTGSLDNLDSTGKERIVAKWAKFTEAGVINDDVGIFSVTNPSAGKYTVNFSTPYMTNTNYAVMITPHDTTTSSRTASVITQTTSSLTLEISTSGGALSNPTVGCHIMIVGSGG